MEADSWIASFWTYKTMIGNGITLHTTHQPIGCQNRLHGATVILCLRYFNKGQLHSDLVLAPQWSYRDCRNAISGEKKTWWDVSRFKYEIKFYIPCARERWIKAIWAETATAESLITPSYRRTPYRSFHAEGTVSLKCSFFPFNILIALLAHREPAMA